MTSTYVARRGLKLAANLDYAGVVVVWSWPSEGSAFGYAYDEDSAPGASRTWPNWCATSRQPRRSATRFCRPQHGQSHPVADAARVRLRRGENLPIGAAIFAAPDIAQDVFKEQIRLARKVATSARFMPRNMIAPS